MDVNVDKDLYSVDVKKIKEDEEKNLNLIELERIMKLKNNSKKGQYVLLRQFSNHINEHLFQFIGICSNCAESFVITVHDKNAGLTKCECGEKYYIKEEKLYNVK
jgi:hypothetical protein